jgi:glycosyltransferase involved in cell wall biosynthesis
VRILLLTPAFVADPGLSIPGLVDLLRALMARHAIDVHVVTGDPVRGLRTVRDIPMRTYGRGSNLARLAELLGRAAVGPRPDVVWSWWVDRTGWPAAAVSRLLGRPLVLSVIGSELAMLPALGYGYLLRPAARAHLAMLTAAARATTVGSHPLYGRLGGIARGPLRIAPLGIAAPPPARPRARGERLLAVTRLEPVKQPEVLLGAIATLARRGHGVTLDVYGYATPAEVDRLRRDAAALGLADRVRHRGFIEPRALAAIYGDYDALLHASLYESQGMALVEAAAAGLPIACFDVGVARELEALGASMFIAERTEDLADRVIAALDRPKTPAARGVLERFSVVACARRFEAVLEEACA